MTFEAFNKRFLLYTTYASRVQRGGGFKFASQYDRYIRDAQAIEDRTRESDRHGIQQLDRERRNELPVEDQIAPGSITAVTNFFASAGFCESCELIPVIKLIRSMDGNQQAHAESRTPTAPNECSMCQIFNEQGMTHGNRTVRPQVNSWIYFQLLNSWLDKCHLEHAHATPPLSRLPDRIEPGSAASRRMPAAPLRLLDVQARPIRIVRNRTKSHYVALSHRWTSEERIAVDTFWNGLPKRGSEEPDPDESIEIVTDPALAKFADAVTVTQRLGMRYLWVDSLCIDQRRDDPGAEKERAMECSRMELIYSQAYCVVAVIRSHPIHGFLSPSFGGGGHDEEDGTSLHLPSGVAEPSLRIVSGERERADFDRDVLRSEWNERGWTFQERALACHTIYFAGDHVYWECGESTVSGTQAGSFRSDDQTPYADSQFPQLGSGADLDLDLAKTIYKDYSRRHLTHATDRPVAVMGLEYRLAVRYLCYGVFGVLHPNASNSSRARRDTCLHETLAWRRRGASLVDISWGDGPGLAQRAPSWSWMSRTGEIDYVGIDRETFRPAQLGFRYEELAETPGTKQLQLHAKLLRKKLDEASSVADNNEVSAVRNGERMRVGKLSYDRSSTYVKAYGRGDELHVVEIGSASRFGDPVEDVLVGDRDKCLVLLVEKKPLVQGASNGAPGPGNGEYYHRAGWGIFEKDWLSSEAEDGGMILVV